MTRLKSRFGSGPGFTLLEVVVAMAIVGLGVVTLLEIFSSGLQLGARSRDRTEAVAYGRQVMDRFLARRTRRVTNRAQLANLRGGSFRCSLSHALKGWHWATIGS